MENIKIFNFEKGVEEQPQFYEFDPDFDIYLVQYGDQIGTRTFSRKEGPPDQINCKILEFLGKEEDILRPHVEYKHSRYGGCVSGFLREDGSCACLRAKRLAHLKLENLEPVSDEVLNKIYTHWEHIFPQYMKKPSFEELKKKYNG